MFDKINDMDQYDQPLPGSRILPSGSSPPERDDPRGRVLPVAKLWLDGRFTPVQDATVAVAEDGRAWRVAARLPEHDPFLRTYGLSAQLGDGRALHGRVRLAAAGDGQVVFEGREPPEGGWV